MKITILISFAFLVGISRGQENAEVLYTNDFEKAEPGKVPEDFMVIEGAFKVKEEKGNGFLELPGAPLDSYGVLIGPNESSNIVVSARIYGSATGRRYPTFAVGLNGVGGYKLQVAPGKRTLDLYKGDEVVAHTPYNWQSETWTILMLQVRSTKGQWQIEGKAWDKGAKAPQDWAISFVEKNLPPTGRPSIWGSPFSSKPIRFDDLHIARLKH